MPQSLIIVILLSVLAVVAVAEILSLKLDPYAVSLDYTVNMDLTEPDEIAALSFRFQNHSALPMPFVSFSFVFSEAVEVREEKTGSRRQGKEGLFGHSYAYQAPLMPHRARKGTLRFSLKERGRHELGKIYVETGDFLGFREYVYRMENDSRIVIYPAKLDDHSYSWWLYDDYYRFLKNATLNINGETISLEDYRCKIQKGYSICEPGKEIDVIYDEAIETVMTQAYLYLSDRLCMGCSLEGRSPLLDYKLYEHVMSLPLEYKYVPGKPKQYMKDVLVGIVPDYILYASKRGFASPPSFVTHVAQHYQYQCFDSDYKFYGSVLADQLLAKLLKK